jgi:hypothetical protein
MSQNKNCTPPGEISTSHVGVNTSPTAIAAPLAPRTCLTGFWRRCETVAVLVLPALADVGLGNV